MGWRYSLFTLGSIVIFLGVIRLFVFRIPESPYYLLAHGRDAEAIAVIEFIAKKSNKPCTVTLEMLEQINSDFGHDSENHPQFTTVQLFLKPFKQLSFKSLKPLFGTPKLALQTSLFTWLWAAAGLAYPLYTVFLPLYLSAKNAKLDAGDSISATYREYCYIAACTIPGPVIAGYVIETRVGRRYALAISALVTGMFLYLSTLAETNAAVVGFNCTATVVINFFLAIQVRCHCRFKSGSLLAAELDESRDLLGLVVRVHARILPSTRESYCERVVEHGLVCLRHCSTDRLQPGRSQHQRPGIRQRRVVSANWCLHVWLAVRD